jgi:PAS domain S-box-containing protein
MITPGDERIGVDVTERRLAAENARLLESRYRRLVERNAAAVLCSTVDGRILYCNEAFVSLLGCDSPAEVKERRAPEFHDDPRGREEMVEALKEKKAITGYEIRFKRKDGSPIWCLANLALVEADGLDGDVIEATLIDITGRKRADEAVHEANLRLRQLAADLLRSQDYERRRIAKELHDNTAQLLAALSMTLCYLRDAELTPERKGVLLSEAIDLAAQSSREMRVLSYLLHPPLLNELGIAGALASYAQGFRQHSGIEIEVDVAPDFGRLDQDLEIALFRIVQEGLANIGRRDGDVLAAIRLERSPCEVRLELKEFYRGFSAHPGEPGRVPPPLGVGILGMRERAEQLGGRLEITSTDVGTTLAVTLPLAHSDEKDAHTGGG